MDPLRYRLRELQSTTIIAVQLHHETTAIWENTGEKDAEKQPTPRSSKIRDKTTSYGHWGKATTCIKVWKKYVADSADSNLPEILVPRWIRCDVDFGSYIAKLT